VSLTNGAVPALHQFDLAAELADADQSGGAKVRAYSSDLLCALIQWDSVSDL